MDDGRRVSAETFRRLACDCSLLGVMEDEEREVLDIGRKFRRIPPALRRAVMLRDGGCCFPGCTHDRYIDPPLRSAHARRSVEKHGAVKPPGSAENDGG